MLTRRRIAGLALLSFGLFAAWVFWNRPAHADMGTYVPADCIAFVEANDLAKLAYHVSDTNAWKALAPHIGAEDSLAVNPWLVRLARWTGFGSSESLILARSQVAVVFTDAQTNQTGTVLTVKPVAALIIETHTTARRMRPIIEKVVEDFANRVIGSTVRQEKRDSGVDFTQWSSQDGNRRLSLVFTGTAAIVSNDDSLLVRCVNVRRGGLASLGTNQQLSLMREKVAANDASIFGFIPNLGMKALLQAWLLSQPGASEDSLTVARLFGDTFGNLIDGLGCSSRFAEGATEDRCFASLTAGVEDQIRSSIASDVKANDKILSFAPADSYSISVYHLRDVDGFWRALNTSIAAHADVLAAIAARPFLRGLIKPYGVEDADSFARGIGPNFATIRLDSTSRSVLIAEAFDRQILRKLAQQRLGANAKNEAVADVELMLSGSDDWGIAFADNYFLSGPAESIRRCLQAKAQSQSLPTVDQFRRAQKLIDVSLQLNVAKFTDDRQSAISFVDLFSKSERPTFSSSAESVDSASRTLPYAVSVALLKAKGFEWTSRSSFGLMGSLFVYLAPEKAR